MDEGYVADASHQTRVARVAWAAHILAYLAKQRSHPLVQQANVSPEGEEEDQEDTHGEDLDAETEIAVYSAGTSDSMRSKFLDCVAQLLSSSKGWDHVTATALREREDFVEVDVARNDCFGARRRPAAWSKIHEFAPGTAEAALCTALTTYLSAADHIDNYENSSTSVSDFERFAIVYAEGRVDYWTQQLQDLLGSHNECFEDDLSTTRVARHASTAWHAMKDLLGRSDAATVQFREQLVRQAFVCVSNLESRILIHAAFETNIAQKIWSGLKFLSRPLADCRMLRSIASRHRQFRNLKICPVQQKEKTSISSQYRVDIAAAWGQLTSSPTPAAELKTLLPFGKSFKRDCATAYSLHAEMQLIMHYNVGAARRPTFDYFGCSKKSCLLCESFLQSLPSPIGTRGRHGICYPAWGAPNFASSEIATALTTLKDLLVSRIKHSLQTELRLHLAQVPQSTLVSDFSGLTVQALVQKDKWVKEAVKEQDELREKQSILKGHASVSHRTDLSAPQFDPQDSCVMCNKSPAKMCARCKSCYYCSLTCQKSDWPCHKRLCKAFAAQCPRPSSSHRRAIYFPVDSEQPQMIWVPCERTYSSMYNGQPGKPFDRADLDGYFGNDRPMVRSIHIEHNPVRNRNMGSGMAYFSFMPGGYSVALEHRETFLRDGSLLNQSLLASVATSGTVPHQWRGPLVAIRRTYEELCEDITLGDFRHLIDYVTRYLSTETPESNPDRNSRLPNTVRGVKICCYGEIRLHGSEPFVSVEVPRNHPARNQSGKTDVSRVSDLLGIPLILWKYPDIQNWINPPGWGENMGADSNQNAAFLMIETRLKNRDWGWAPIYWNTDLGNVLAIRKDGNDLNVDDMQVMCRFIREEVQPRFEDAMGSGLVHRTREEVLAFTTRGNMLKFKEEMVNEEKSENLDGDDSWERASDNDDVD